MFLRPHLLRLAAVLTAAFAGPPPADAQGKFPGPSPVVEANASQVKPDLFEGRLKRIPELAMRRTLQAKALVPYAPESFADTETFVADLIGNEARTPSGVWKLGAYYIGFVNMYGDSVPESLIDQYLGAVAHWRTVHPQSATPVIVEGILRRNRAFKVWKQETADQEQQRAEFEKRLREVRTFYVDHKRAGEADPMWYANLIEIAGDLCETDDAAKLLEEGTARHPSFHAIYFKALDVRSKCATGKTGFLEDIGKITALARERAKEPGDSMYARLQWYLHEMLGKSAFALPSFDAKRMATGMKDVLAQYDEPWNLNNFALFACEMGDIETARPLLQRVLEAPVAQVWGSPDAFYACWQWAHATADSAAGAP